MLQTRSLEKTQSPKIKSHFKTFIMTVIDLVLDINVNKKLSMIGRMIKLDLKLKDKQMLPMYGNNLRSGGGGLFLFH